MIKSTGMSLKELQKDVNLDVRQEKSDEVEMAIDDLGTLILNFNSGSHFIKVKTCFIVVQTY